MTPTQIREKVVYVAKSNLGYGEEERNNDGRVIRAMGGIPGQEWCALLAGYCYRRAYQILGLSAPRWAWRRYPSRLEVGAKALVKALGAQGIRFTDPALALPGDLVAWNRGIGWTGHVGVVVENLGGGRIRTIEGNVGRFPSKIREFTHVVANTRLYAFAGLR